MIRPGKVLPAGCRYGGLAAALRQKNRHLEGHIECCQSFVGFSTSALA